MSERPRPNAKRRIHRILRGAVIVCVSMAVVGVLIDRTLLDGLDGLLWSRMFGEDTEFAPRYADERFKRVHEGMTSQRVLELLGEPLSACRRHGRRRRGGTHGARRTITTAYVSFG